MKWNFWKSNWILFQKNSFPYSTGIVSIFHGQKGRWGIEVMHAIGKPTWVVLYCHWINHWEYKREKKIQQTCVLKQISVNNTMHTRREENIARIASAFPCHWGVTIIVKVVFFSIVYNWSLCYGLLITLIKCHEYHKSTGLLMVVFFNNTNMWVK